MAATVVAVCVVHQIRPDPGRVGRTAVGSMGPGSMGPDRTGPGYPDRLRRLAEAGLELNHAARIALGLRPDDPAG